MKNLQDKKNFQLNEEKYCRSYLITLYYILIIIPLKQLSFLMSDIKELAPYLWEYEEKLRR